MRFSVPQFIEIEDKIFGPFTFKQFVYLAGGAAICFLVYNFIPFFLISILLILPIGGFALALAFYRVNNKPFINVVESAVSYFIHDKLYIWEKRVRPPVQEKDESRNDTISYVPRLSDSKLKDLAWSLDVLDTNKNKN